MKIPQAIIDKWELLKSEGDPIKISEKNDFHVETIRMALRKKECSDDVFNAIAEFYEEKLQMISQYV